MEHDIKSWLEYEEYMQLKQWYFDKQRMIDLYLYLFKTFGTNE